MTSGSRRVVGPFSISTSDFHREDAPCPKSQSVVPSASAHLLPATPTGFSLSMSGVFAGRFQIWDRTPSAGWGQDAIGIFGTGRGQQIHFLFACDWDTIGRLGTGHCRQNGYGRCDACGCAAAPNVGVRLMRSLMPLCNPARARARALVTPLKPPCSPLVTPF